ncbi:MAG TPA: FAD-dependent oxidoreductase [Thermoplasmata archaeon]|nr:FAD-dependent oxidoreductase [Thermoplasmata archaeon]
MQSAVAADRFDVAVLGGGLFGAALARFLAPDRRVALIDADDPRLGPSGTATSAGILSVQGWDPWDLALVRETAVEYGRIASSEGCPAPRRSGGVRVARTDEGVRWLDRVERGLVSGAEESLRLGRGELENLLPFADLADVSVGLFTPADSWVDPAELRAAFLRAGVRAGVELCRTVSAIPERRDPDWLLNGPEPTVAKSLVVACGASTRSVLDGIGCPLPLAPFRAQVVRIRPCPLQGAFPTLHDLDLNLYARPDAHGRVLVGDGTGTVEEDPLHWAVSADPEFTARISAITSDLLVGLNSLRIERAWAGLCVASPDRFPLVGRVPGAPGLFVASGFNGFGTMRAAALARRLADAMRSGEWDDLRPADPGRFRGSVGRFGPRPEFPLEGPEPDEALPPPPRPLRPAADGQDEDGVAYRRLHSLAEIARLRFTPLSEWFDPFLPYFARDAVRTGGGVEVGESEGKVRGVLLSGSAEGVASGFTRVRRIAERFLEGVDVGGIYLEEPWRAGGATVEIYAADLRDYTPAEPLRNKIRIARGEDLPAIRALMRAELGAGVDAWIGSLPRPEETGFLCEIDGRAAGVSWLSRAGAFARGHSFVVHPRFRGLGIGSDLLTARMLWLKRTGGRSVVSEIYDGNAASRTAAERAGMALVGKMYHFPGPAPHAGVGTRSGERRTSDSSSPSNQ